MMTERLGAAAGGMILIAIIAIGCGGATPSQHESESLSVLDKISVAFNGNPPATVVKEALDRALLLYNTTPSEDNYSRAASTLIALRRENGTNEMAVLDHMIRSHVPGVNLTFPQAAAVSSVALKAGDR